MAFTALFMASGAVASYFTGTMQALGVTNAGGGSGLQFVAATSAELQTMVIVAGSAAALFAVIGALFGRCVVRMHVRMC